MCTNTAAIFGLTMIGVSLCMLLGFIDWGTFGDDKASKYNAYMKAAISVFIAIGIIIVCIMAITGLIKDQLFISLLSFGLTGLGFKLGLDYRR